MNVEANVTWQLDVWKRWAQAIIKFRICVYGSLTASIASDTWYGEFPLLKLVGIVPNASTLTTAAIRC